MQIIIFTRLTIKVLPTTSAAVLPAEINPSPTPSATAFKPTDIELSVFDLITHFGSSCIEITLWASNISTPLKSYLFSLAHFSISSRLPERIISIPHFSRALKAPSIIAFGALSPPKASTIIFINISPFLKNFKKCFGHTILAPFWTT